jgi:hypothetical protein
MYIRYLTHQSFTMQFFDQGIGWFFGAQVGELSFRPMSKHIMHRGPYHPKWFFFGRKVLLTDHVRLDKSFPMGPCPTSGD